MIKIRNHMIDEKNIVLDEWFEIWLRYYNTTISDKTKYNYKSYYNKVSNELGRFKVIDLRQNILIEFFHDLEEYGYSKYTIKETKMLLKRMMDTARKNDLIKLNPIPNKFISQNESVRNNSITLEEQKLLMKYLYDTKHELRDMIIIFLLTGIRNAELRALTFESVDFDKGLLYINKAVIEHPEVGIEGLTIGLPKTKSSIRTLPLNTQALKCFKKLFDKGSSVDSNTLKKHGNLIFSKHGKLMKSGDIGYMFKKLTVEMNKNGYAISSLHPHRFRHSFAENCISSNINLKTVSNFLGHASVKTTYRCYIHMLNEDFMVNEIKKLKVSNL